MRASLCAALLASTALAQVCEPRRASVDATGAQADRGSTTPCFSADGSRLAYASSAANLVPGDLNGCDDIFVVELATGLVERASLADGGLESNGPSNGPSLSADGRLACFSSFATNLVAGDANGQNDVYVRDRIAGTTTLVSRGLSGGSALGSSFTARISPDGRRVAFLSWAADLVPGDANWTRDLFVHELATGATTRVQAQGVEPDGQSGGNFGPRWSEDGRFLAFASEATNLVPGDLNGRMDVFVLDLVAGTLTLASRQANLLQHADDSDLADLSLDGGTLLVLSAAKSWTNGDFNDALDLFAVDRATSAATCVSLGFEGATTTGGAWVGALSRDARFVAFVSDSEKIVPGDVNEERDVFLVDRLAGRTERANVSPATGPSTGGVNFPAMHPAGDIVACVTGATDLAPGDTNDAWDVYLLGCKVGVLACHGASAACPCANQGAEGAGCASSAGFGARLVAQGRAALSADTLSLSVAGLPPDSVAQLYCGQPSAGSGTPFGDGVRCFGAPYSASAPRRAIGGMARFGFGVAGDLALSQLGQVQYSPESRHYQVRYRDPAPHCGPATFNFSAALRVEWAP